MGPADRAAVFEYLETLAAKTKKPRERRIIQLLKSELQPKREGSGRAPLDKRSAQIKGYAALALDAFIQSKMPQDEAARLVAKVQQKLLGGDTTAKTVLLLRRKCRSKGQSVSPITFEVFNKGYASKQLPEEKGQEILKLLETGYLPHEDGIGWMRPFRAAKRRVAKINA